jgi:hypothetical protein
VSTSVARKLPLGACLRKYRKALQMAMNAVMISPARNNPL